MKRVLELRRGSLDPLLKETRQRHRVVLQTDVDGAERVYSMLQHLIQLRLATEESFQICLRAFLQRDRIRWKEKGTYVNAAELAKQLLSQLEEHGRTTTVSLETYNLVLQAFAVCATPRSKISYAQWAEDLLQRMPQHNDTSVMHVIHAHAWEQVNRGSSEDHTHRAQELLEQLEDTCKDNRILLQAYDYVIEAWSKSASSAGAERADRFLHKMKDINGTRSPDDPAGQIFTVETYSNAILAWSKSNHDNAARRALELLVELIDLCQDKVDLSPPLIAFNAVLSALGRDRKPEQAEQLLQRMYSSGCQPDTVSYNSVLHGYFLSNNKNRMKRIWTLVDYMENNCAVKSNITPNAFTYYTLLKTSIESGEPNLAEIAEKTLIKMERLWNEGDRSVQPNNRVFNMVINAYAKSGDHRGARKAIELLNRMKKSDICKPDTISYTSVLECLSKSNDADACEKAQALLQETFDLYNETGDPSHRPNVRTFTMVIQTLAKNHGKVSQARSLLTQLVDLYYKTQDAQLQPNTHPFNAVMNCAANALVNKTEAFRIATITYQDMRKSNIAPDSFTYAFWLKCCNKLLDPSLIRTKCVTFAVAECKDRGLVTSEVLTRFIQGSPPSLVSQLLEIPESQVASIRVQDLPPSWTRNTRHYRR